MSLEHRVAQESKAVLQKKKEHHSGDVSKGHKIQLREIPVAKARTI